MSDSKDKSNLRGFAGQLPSIEVVPHPYEILELDDETVAIARARLAGLEFAEIYGDEDRSSPGLKVRTQAKKIRDLFQTLDELRDSFSSEQKKEQTRKDMMIDGIDLDFVKGYCQKRQIDFVDDADALIAVGFANESSGDTSV